MYIFQDSYNTPLEHTPGNPRTQLWKDSLYSLLRQVKGCVPKVCWNNLIYIYIIHRYTIGDPQIQDSKVRGQCYPGFKRTLQGGHAQSQRTYVAPCFNLFQYVCRFLWMFCRGLRGVVFSHFRIFPKPQFRTLLQVGKSMVLPGLSLSDEKQKAKSWCKIWRDEEDIFVNN